MKKLLLLLMIVSMIGFGQTKKFAVVSATKMNILYQQVENPISVAVPEVKLSEISVEINNGTITKQSDGYYIVIPVKSGKAMITVYVNTKKGEVAYASWEFRVIAPPEDLSDLEIKLLNIKQPLANSKSIGDNISKSDWSEKYKFSVVSATNMNILYQQIENPISVAVAEVKLSEISVEINNGTITKQKDGKYIVKPVKIGKATITVYVNTKKGEVKYGSMDFRVKRVPPPNALIMGAKFGSISKSELLVSGGVIAKMKDFYFERIGFEVVSYEFTITIDAETYNVKNTRAQFNKKIQSLIKKAPNGTQITFHNIKAKRVGLSHSYPLHDISLTIEW